MRILLAALLVTALLGASGTGRLALAEAIHVPSGADLAPPQEASDPEHQCLALNIYWEARGEALLGQLAVAFVTVNRRDHPGFPKSICAVVRHSLLAGTCQFSWFCNGRSKKPTDPKAWQIALRLAGRVLANLQEDPTDGALYFHQDGVNPAWSTEKELIRRVGRHLYYR